MIDQVTIECPYCGEPFTTLADWSAGEQRYVEDCQICCRPIEIALTLGLDGEPGEVVARREDD